MPSPRAALLFPGQGAQSQTMLDGLSACDEFRTPLAIVNETLGYDLPDAVRKGTASIHANLTSSLMTVLASVVSLELLRKTGVVAGSIAGTAGYSVGQWVALYAAGAISLEQLIRIVHRRAVLMDECAARKPGSMIAVIGVGEKTLDDYCDDIRGRGWFVAIANYNAVGQYTLAMEAHAVETVMQGLQALKPIKCVPLQAAGPWHSALMKSAGDALAEWIADETFRTTAIPTIDNSTGAFLPEDAACRERLAEHVYRPVRWSRGVETLVAAGAERFIEVGYGNMLTKFGFFINRQVEHRTFYTSLA